MNRLIGIVTMAILFILPSVGLSAPSESWKESSALVQPTFLGKTTEVYWATIYKMAYGTDGAVAVECEVAINYKKGGPELEITASDYRQAEAWLQKIRITAKNGRVLKEETLWKQEGRRSEIYLKNKDANATDIFQEFFAEKTKTLPISVRRLFGGHYGIE